MFPQRRPGLMSPMQLEVLARTEGMGAYPDVSSYPTQKAVI